MRPNGSAGFASASPALPSSCQLFALALILSCAARLETPASAQDKQPDTPRITAIAPLEIVPGTATTLRIRGVKLNDATEVQFPDARVPLIVEITSKKAAEVPNGLDAKDVGDTQIEVSVTVPAELPAGVLALRIVTPAGTTTPRSVRVAEGSTLLDEKEPNNGYREAQPVALGKIVRGTLQADKDVDVFAFTTSAKQISAEVFASRGASSLDPVLTLTDTRGRVLATCDDAAGRDPQLTIAAPADGRFLVTIQDANDRGGPWHSYELVVKEVR